MRRRGYARAPPYFISPVGLLSDIGMHGPQVVRLQATCDCRVAHLSQQCIAVNSCTGAETEEGARKGIEGHGGVGLLWRTWSHYKAVFFLRTVMRLTRPTKFSLCYVSATVDFICPALARVVVGCIAL